MEAESSSGSPDLSIKLIFRGESFDPDEITRRIGVEPTTTYRKGDLIRPGRSDAVRAHDHWRLMIGPTPGVFVFESILEELRRRFDVDPRVVSETCDDLGLKLAAIAGILQPISATTPVFVFPPDFVAWLGELGAELDVDLILSE